MAFNRLYKIIGGYGYGKLACGCYLHKGEEYFIEVSEKAAYAKCIYHVDKYTEYSVIRIPEDLKEGVIPI